MRKKDKSSKDHVDPFEALRQLSEKREKELEHTYTEEEGEKLFLEDLAYSAAWTLVVKRGLKTFLSMSGSGNNADLIRQRLSELQGQGADIGFIMNAVILPAKIWQMKTGTFDMRSDFSKANLKKNDNRIRRAFEHLTEELTPELRSTPQGQRIARRMAEMQAEVSAILKRYETDIQEYFNLKLAEPYLATLVEGLSAPDADYILYAFPPHKIADMCRKKLRPAKHVWNESIFFMVTEFRRIGYSWSKAYKETAELLSLFYSEVYKDIDDRVAGVSSPSDLVRQRYKTYAKKLKDIFPAFNDK